MEKVVEINRLLRHGNSTTIYVNKWRERCEPDFHSHKFIEMEYVLSGNGIHIVDEVEIPVKAGYMFFTNYGVKHCFISENEENPLNVINVGFTPKMLENVGLNFEEFVAVASDVMYKFLFPGEFEDQPYLMVRDEARKLQGLFETMHTEYTTKSDGYESVLLGCLCQTLVWFMRLYEKQNSLTSAVKATQVEYINAVLEYVQKNYAVKVSLHELAQIALLSPSHLCKVFKELTGKTVLEHIQELRIEKACELLRDSSKTIEAVAELVGYNDARNFRRAFKKELGQSPKQYRENL